MGAGRYAEFLDLWNAPDPLRQQVLSGGIDEYWSTLAGDLPFLSDLRRLRVLAELGRSDEFFAVVDSVLGDTGFGINLPQFLADPGYDSVRQDPRWEEQVLRRVGLSLSGG